MSDSYEQLPVRCFISYRRVDNTAFLGVVDRIKSDLSGRFEAATGRKLEIFLDRDNIGWGEDWREKINSSIRQATFFIPILTARYFDSPACREEFLAFHENANELGVTELIMPIILSGMAQLQRAEEPEPAAVAMGLQCVRIDDEFLDGFESPSWNRKIHAMVQGLEEALYRAEANLAAREGFTTVTDNMQAMSSLQGGEAEPAEVASDLLEMQSKIDELKDQLPEVGKDFTDLAEKLMGTMDSGFFNLPRQRQTAILLRLAKDIEKPSIAFKESAGALERSVSAIDAQLRMMLQEFSEMESQDGRAMGSALINGFNGLEGVQAIRDQMVTASDAFQTAGMFNVNLRRAIRPALAGASSLRTVLDILAAWNEIPGE